MTKPIPLPDFEDVTVGPKGEIIIPARMRRRLGVRAGARVMIRADDERLTIVKPMTDAYIDACRGMLGDTSDMIEQLRRDHELEDK